MPGLSGSATRFIFGIDFKGLAPAAVEWVD
jgi:hypothetical protein